MESQSFRSTVWTTLMFDFFFNSVVSTSRFKCSFFPSFQCSMPSCIVAFHVTCAFDHGLEMRTILAENDEVRFKSFCLEHSCTASCSGVSAATNNMSSLNNGNHVNNPATNGTGRANSSVGSELRLDQQHQSNGGGDLEPKTVLSAAAVSASERAERDQLEREKVSQRKQKLQELEDEFYRLVDPREVAENLGLPNSHVSKTVLVWKWNVQKLMTE